MLNYHYTSKANMESILKEGLLIKNDARTNFIREYGTSAVNIILNKYKPDGINENIDLGKSVFFYGECNHYYENEIEIKIDTAKIDTSNLYAFSNDDADKIWCEVIDAVDSGQHIVEPLDVVAKRYWGSMLSFEDYLKNKENIECKIELLYFGQISKDCITITEK